jgi:hypothetical protein
MSTPCMYWPTSRSVQELLLMNSLLVYSAHPYGTPTVLSSYDTFYNYDEGAPNGGTTCLFYQ